MQEFIFLLQKTCKIGTVGVIVTLLLAIIRLVIIRTFFTKDIL